MTETPTMMPETMPITSEGIGLTVVEFFQSQGCNSCPPSNDNIMVLSAHPNLLILTYHVTYWDSLGWKDTFGNSAFDKRQVDYAHGLKKSNVYTPQVIINGRVDGVGNCPHDLKSLIYKGIAALSADVVIRDGQVIVSGPESASGLVHLVRYDPHFQDVAISHGENRGKTLPHKNVVTDVVLLGEWSGGEKMFMLPTMTGEGEKTAILVQAGTGGVILGAARL